MKICINAGHAPDGNPDPGAVGASGLRESDVANEISELVMFYLQQAGNYDVLLVQDDNLQSICDQSNNFGSQLFISVHCNAAENSAAQGTETFCLTELSESGKLAKCIQSQIITSMGTVDRGVKTDRFYVLRNTDCPAVLVESCFISNEEDEALLASKQGKDDIARAIARGITDYVAK